MMADLHNFPSLEAALDHLRQRALGNERASQLATVMSNSREGRKRDEAYVTDAVALARELYRAGRITMEEYLFHVAYPIEGLCEGRWMGGTFDAELQPLEDAMGEIEKAYGLEENQYWRRGDAPPEYLAINQQYESLLDKKLIETFEEFGETDLAKLRREDPEIYDDLREKARKSIFEKTNVAGALNELASTFEAEAISAAGNGAYLAATIMIGSAVECRLLSKAHDNLPAACKAYGKLHDKMKRKKTSNPLQWSFETLIAVASEAGWLGNLEAKEFPYYAAPLADIIRLHRNMVHPGRYVKERPFLQVGYEMYEDARACYSVLRETLV